jgi:hypothetical protein
MEETWNARVIRRADAARQAAESADQRATDASVEAQRRLSEVKESADRLLARTWPVPRHQNGHHRPKLP